VAEQIAETGVRRRAEYLYQQLDSLQQLRREVRRNLLSESRKHNATKILSDIPTIGPIRSALLVALIQTPHRFRTKRQLWAYSGLALETHDSAEYRYLEGKLLRSRKPQQLRGLNQNHNHDLKSIFKGAAQKATVVHRSLYVAVPHRSHYGSKVAGSHQNSRAVVMSRTVKNQLFRKTCFVARFSEEIAN
jgi:transposase